MSVISILGNTSPRIGTVTKYVAITPYANILRNSMATSQENILWDIYVLENGKWRKTQGNSKKGKEVEYTFTQRSLLRKGIKLVANIDGKTGELLIKPMPALAPKILKVELLDINGKKVDKLLSYMDTLVAKAHCVDMEGEIVSFTLYEDDAKGKGHHVFNEINKIVSVSSIVRKGVAKARFPMTQYHMVSIIVANMQKAKGDASEGNIHEYYVTAEYYEKKEASNNVNIKNEQPQPNTPKTSTQKSSKYNILDEKGIVYSIELQDSKGNKINRNIRYGETIKVVIRGHNLVGKPCVLKLWEHDTFGDNDLLYRQNIIMKNSPHEVSITLTPQMKTKGEVGGNLKNPDIGEYFTGNYQEIFAEVVYGNTFHKTDTIQVSIDAQPTKQETPKSASKVDGDKKDEIVSNKDKCYCYLQGIVKKSCKEKGNAITDEHFESLSQDLGVDKKVFKAVAIVESGGKESFVNIENTRKAKILYERHYMYRFLKNIKTKEQLEALKETQPNIVHNIGIYKDPSAKYGTTKEQFDKLAKAKEINEGYAIQSCSWGKFQVMGKYYNYLYSSPQELEEAMNMCEIQHFAYFKVFLKDVTGTNIIKAMKDKNWSKIAELYNGKDYAINKYHIKMKEEYEKQ